MKFSIDTLKDTIDYSRILDVQSCLSYELGCLAMRLSDLTDKDVVLRPYGFSENNFPSSLFDHVYQTVEHDSQERFAEQYVGRHVHEEDLAYRQTLLYGIEKQEKGHAFSISGVQDLHRFMLSIDQRHQ